VRKTSTIVRAIAILDHPLPGTHNADSCQIIIPQRQVCVCVCERERERSCLAVAGVHPKARAGPA
jgi:hypothetical protein